MMQAEVKSSKFYKKPYPQIFASGKIQMKNTFLKKVLPLTAAMKL